MPDNGRRRIAKPRSGCSGFCRRRRSQIGDGENGGRTITYHNVVRGIRAVGTWKGQPVTVTLPRAQAGAPHEGIAVLVQQGGYGRVLGATLVAPSEFRAEPLALTHVGIRH